MSVTLRHRWWELTAQRAGDPGLKVSCDGGLIQTAVGSASGSRWWPLEAVWRGLECVKASRDCSHGDVHLLLLSDRPLCTNNLRQHQAELQAIEAGARSRIREYLTVHQISQQQGVSFTL
jgi:hypothetical protein